MDELWKQFAGDFNSLTDEEIELEAEAAQQTVDEQQEWLDAVASWKAAGKPRSE